MNKEKYYVWKVNLNRKELPNFHVSWILNKYGDCLCKFDVQKDTIVFHFKFRKDAGFNR